MAQYTISHTCNHTSNAILYGPEKDRQKTIAYRATGLCPDCWSKQQREAADAAGPLITYRAFGPAEKRSLEILFTRSTYAIKDLLKARGYRFGEYTINASFLDLNSRGEKGWAKTIPASDRAALDAEIAWLMAETKAHGWEAHQEHPLATAFASLTEGRIELAG